MTEEPKLRWPELVDYSANEGTYSVQVYYSAGIATKVT
jgi:hypothetical protein